jgi:hypothetical protein
VFFGKVFRLDVGTSRERMRRRHDGDEFIVEERFAHQALVVDLARDDGEVDLPLEQCLERAVGGIDHDLNVDAGKLTVKLLQQWRQPVIAGVALCAQAQDALAVLRHQLEVLLGPPDFVEHSPRSAEHALARGREDHLLAEAEKQLQAEA